MRRLTRRDFIKEGTSVLAVGALMPAPTPIARAIASAAARQEASVGDTSKTLIVVQLAGGNDGLNTVVPYADQLYQQARPTLGIPEDQLIKLDDHLALHASLQGLKQIWDEDHLAIVENVGYPNPDLSHFKSMAIWEMADPTLALHQGWLATLVDGTVDASGQQFRGLSVGAMLNPSLCCPTMPPAAVNSLSDYRLQPDQKYPKGQSARDEAVKKLYEAYGTPLPQASLLAATAQTAERSSKMLLEAVGQYQPAATYPKGAFGDGLRLLATLVAQDVGLRVGYIGIGGFDTHYNQAPQHAQILKALGDGLLALQTDIAAHGKADRVLTMTWSEFGRRVAENASGGTDHGTAAPLFVLGSSTKGGIYGDPPNLKDLDNGNLRFATDFRSVYATVLDGWLGVDAASILGKQFAKVGFV